MVAQDIQLHVWCRAALSLWKSLPAQDTEDFLPELRQRTQEAEIRARCSPERPHTYCRGVQPLPPSAMGWKGHPGHAFGVTAVASASPPRAFCQLEGLSHLHSLRPRADEHFHPLGDGVTSSPRRDTALLNQHLPYSSRAARSDVSLILESENRAGNGREGGTRRSCTCPASGSSADRGPQSQTEPRSWKGWAGSLPNGPD